MVVPSIIVVNIIASNFINNIAWSDGGAIYNYLGASVNVTNANFSGNTANNGDGAAIYNRSICDVMLSTFF